MGKTKGPVLRRSGERLRVPNSGLEVWLYDESHRDRIRVGTPSDGLPTGMPARFEERTREGLIVGYSLAQDDELDIEIHVGRPLSAKEQGKGRWLAPQTAWLRLPSGRLCVESNDSSRVGSGHATEAGGAVEVPPGYYRLTLHRVDHEALRREGLAWRGPQEVIVLTPGGSAEEAATDLLSFEPVRDHSWVGAYRLDGKRATALVWFGDPWDTFVLNLDLAAIERWSLTPGSYLRTEVAEPAITLVSVYAASWSEARRLPPPAGVPLAEYGFAALSPLGEWDDAVGLLCRRERAKSGIEDAKQRLWLPAVVEVLDVAPLPRGESREPSPSDLSEKQYFDSGFLPLVWSDLLPGAEDADELPLDRALVLLGKRLAKLGLAPLGDREWHESIDGETVESCCRVYSGPGHVAALVFAREGIADVLLITAFDDGTWRVTGLADDFERLVGDARERGAEGSAVTIECRDESVAKIAAAHRKGLARAGAPPLPAPTTSEEVAEFLGRFLAAAFGPPAGG